MFELEVFKSDKDDKWYWRMKHDSDIICWSGQGHSTKQTAVNEARLASECPSTTLIYEV